MKDLLEVFPNSIDDGCLIELTQKHTFIFEDLDIKKGRFVNAFEKYHLHVENKTNQNLNFIQKFNCETE